MKIKIKKIKWSGVFLWKVAFFAFFALLLAIFIFNLYIFRETKEWLRAETLDSNVVESLVIKKELLERATERLAEKKILFRKVLNEGVEIKDPSV